MPEADANRTGLAYVEEETWGLFPVSAGTPLTDLRFTGEALDYGLTFETSKEIRSDRQTTDLIAVGSEAGGNFSFELSFSEFDPLLKAALWSAGWSTPISWEHTDITSKTDGRFESEYSAFTSIATGQWIKADGLGAATADGFFFVTAIRATAIDVTPAPSAENAATGTSVTISGSYIRNGTTKWSYSLQREHADITQFFTYKGMCVNTLDLNVAANAILTGSFGFMGKIATLTQTSGNAGTNTAASSNDVMNAVTDVGQIMEGANLTSIATDLYIQSISLSINNNLRGRPAVANLGNVGVGVGKFGVTGTMSVYFKDNTLFDKFLARTETGLAFKTEDLDGNAYIFTIPKMKFSDDNINASGEDTDVMEGITFTGYRHPTYDCMFQIDKFPA